jgi:3-oxoadipate enol-lactonase/4-carboxymuconolactone decarboxylase
MSDQGYAGAAAAIRDMDVFKRLPQIRCRTLLIGGDQDISTPFNEHGKRIAAAVAGSEVTQLHSAHLAPIEAPAELAAALQRFLIAPIDVKAAEATLYQAGLANRRRVLGDDWVDRSIAARNSFTSDFQNMITRVAWHEVWGRPGLDERTRRLLAVVITAALGRPEEFRLHVRAGLDRGGFTQDELKEALIETGIYAGLPAANSAFSEAAEVIAELEEARMRASV